MDILAVESGRRRDGSVSLQMWQAVGGVRGLSEEQRGAPDGLLIYQKMGQCQPLRHFGDGTVGIVDWWLRVCAQVEAGLDCRYGQDRG